MKYYLGTILFFGAWEGKLAEERTEENKTMKDRDLIHFFEHNKVTFVPDKKSFKAGDIVRFSVARPCGGKFMIDTIKKVEFPSV